MEGPAAAYQTWAQLVYKLLTAEQEYEATGSEETLKTVINTDWGRIFRAPALSNAKVTNCCSAPNRLNAACACWRQLPGGDRRCSGR
jgi:phage terminase large subunit GpA-like protein